MLERKIYKNWKELCEEVGWNPNNRGNYKNARLKELDTLCNWHKEGNKIVIDEIFEVAKEKVDERKNNGGNSTKSNKEDDGRKKKNAIYKELDNIILDYLYCYTSNNTINVTKNQLIKRCGFTIRLQETDEYNKETINDVLDVYKSILTHAIDNSLQRLKKRGFIDYSYCYMIKKNGVLCLATTEEEMKIKEIEEQVKEEMKIKNVFLLNKEIQMSYYDRCNYMCYEQGICNLYYKVININKVANFDRKEMVLTDNKNEQLSLKTIDRQSFVNAVVDSLKKSKVFENNIEKAKEVDILSANDRVKNRINLTYSEEVKSVIEKIKIMLC